MSNRIAKADALIRNIADLEREGDARAVEKDVTGALELFAAAAAETEMPPARLMVKLARAALGVGDGKTAASWCKRVIDAEGTFADWVAAAAAILRRCLPEDLGARRDGLRVALAATWTTKTFAPLLFLAAARCGMRVEIWETDYGQYFTETLIPDSSLFAQQPDVIILMPDDRALGLVSHNKTDPTAVESELARWTAVWDGVRANSRATLVQLGVAQRPGDTFGNFGSGFTGSLSSMTASLNIRLAEGANSADIGFVDVDRLAAHHGKSKWFDDRSWYLAKIPYAPAALCRLAHETAIVLAARHGLSRRCLILDLDNTLWGGVIGDDDLAGIQLGDGVQGEAFVDFQRGLKKLTQRGVLLAVCSKNELKTAREPFESHPEMILKLDDIAAFVANWQPKSENIAQISRDLDLGFESMVFFDDNPYEREEVRRQLPQLDVPILPDDPAMYRTALESYPYFEPGSFTEADLVRSTQYRARARASALRKTASSLEEYQKDLGMVAQIGPIDELNMPRVVQLINKTNQFNLTTRRRNRSELEAFIANSENCHFWVRLSDRFADHGLIAVILGTPDSQVLEVDTFLMSCRVIGRGVENVIVQEIANFAMQRGIPRLRGLYIPTDRNSIVASLYPKLGFSLVECSSAEAFEARPEDISCSAPIRTEHIQ